MMTKEWPLAVFTLLSQTAVGAFWALAIPFLFSRKTSGDGGGLYLNVRTLGGIVVLVGLAAAMSFFHLGSPIRAFHAMKNVQTSWLSREILFELTFLFLAALIGFLKLIKAGRPALLRGLVVLAAFAGLAFLASMARIYMLETVPAWRSLHTPLSFYLSAVLLGSLAAAYSVRQIPIGLALAGRLDNPASVLRGFASFQNAAVVAALVAAALAVILMFAFTPGVGFLGVKRVTLLDLSVSRIWLFLLIRLVLICAAAWLLSAALSRGLAGGSAVDRLLLWALLSALAAEAVGRILFFSLYGRLGV